jgi:hypothetical protein
MDPATAGTWTVTKRVCEACRVQEAVVEGDHESKSPPRGMRYIAHRTDLSRG